MRSFLCFGALLICMLTYASNHNPLLPYPQKIHYGKSQLPLKNLIIRFANQPGVEDRFAVGELAGILSKITGASFKIEDVQKNDASIIFERTGSADPLPVAGEKTGPGTRESYKIDVTAGKVKITAKSSAGLFYAVQTLAQLIEGTGDKAFLPEVEIEDWPSLAYRGFMMDMSHAQLPKIEEIKHQIDFLSRWKANQYFFYSEASIELEGFPLLMANARYTKAQVREVIEYAKARHIDLVPNMELYGHLHDLFRLEHYSDLSVIPHGGEFKPGDPGVKPIIESWVKQIAELFPSEFFHIGFDETWLVEQEAKKVNVAPEELYIKMLKQTTDIVEQQGKHPLVWADMLQKFPSIIPRVSKNTIAVPWHYFPLQEKEYDKLLSPFANANIDMVVQSASVNWAWLVPEYGISFKNTDLLIKAGKKYGAIGFINSGWTDDTQTLMRLGFPDMAYGSIAAWQSQEIDRDNFFTDYAKVQYSPDLAIKVAKAFNSLMKAESLIGNALGSTDAALWANPFTPENLKQVENSRENLHNGRLAAEDAQIVIREALTFNTDTTSLFAMLVGAKMLDQLSLKYLYALEISELVKQAMENPDKVKSLGTIGNEVTFKYHTRTSDMLDGIIEIKNIFQKAWLEEYTPFRLGVALGKYDQEFQLWLRVQRRLGQIDEYINKKEDYPSLDSFLKRE
jgi:hexosaminidase